MQQYFISKNIKIGDCVVFDEEQAHHIRIVLRMRDQEVVRLVDQKNHIFHAHVQKEKKQVQASVFKQVEDKSKSPVKITLIQGLLKGEKWDFLLQKASELGVHSIVPFVSKRSVAKIKEETLDKKLIRWKKIALEACEQSKRSTLVDIQKPITFSQIAQYASQYNIIAYEEADVQGESLGAFLKQNPHITSISIVIGCEGGFEQEEVAYLKEQGFHCISLGGRILRAETAAMYGISALQLYGEMMYEKQS